MSQLSLCRAPWASEASQRRQISPVTNITASQVSGRPGNVSRGEAPLSRKLARGNWGVEAGPLPPKTPAESGQRRRVTAARPLLPAPRVPGECALQRRGHGSGNTQAQTKSSRVRGGGQSQERSVHPGHQREAGAEGPSRGPVPAVSLRCQAHGFSGSPGLPAKPCLLGRCTVFEEPAGHTPHLQFPHLERHMPVTSSGLSEPGAHKKGNEFIAGLCLPKDRGAS